MRWWPWAACAALLSAAAPAAAEGPVPDAQAAARARGEEGLRLFQAGKWDDAFSAFERADGIFHAPTLVVFMAGCRRNQGRLVEAKALYEKVVSEPLPRDPPEAFRKAQATARSEIESLRGRIPFVRVTVTGPGAERAQVTVDGKPIAAAELGAGVSLDPGERELSAQAPGASGRLHLTLKEGESPRLTLALAPDAPRPVEPPRRGSLLPAGIAFGAGGAGLLVGAVGGGLALGKVSAAHAGCVEATGGVWHCPPSSQPSATAAASSAHALTAASTAGFVLGGAGVVTGVVLAILRPASGGEPGKAAIRLDVGPTSIGARGTF
jgi:hypothetical protein